MGKLIFGMMQSLDGYVDHATGRVELPPPGPALHDLRGHVCAFFLNDWNPDAHRHAAAPAAIQPVALLPLLHRTPPQHWTAPGFAELNDVRKIAPTGIAPLEARGF